MSVVALEIWAGNLAKQRDELVDLIRSESRDSEYLLGIAMSLLTNSFAFNNAFCQEMQAQVDKEVQAMKAAYEQQIAEWRNACLRMASAHFGAELVSRWQQTHPNVIAARASGQFVPVRWS